MSGLKEATSLHHYSIQSPYYGVFSSYITTARSSVKNIITNRPYTDAHITTGCSAHLNSISRHTSLITQAAVSPDIQQYSGPRSQRPHKQ